MLTHCRTAIGLPLRLTGYDDNFKTVRFNQVNSLLNSVGILAPVVKGLDTLVNCSTYKERVHLKMMIRIKESEIKG